MSTVYNHTLQKFFRGLIDFADDTIRVALVSNSVAYSPDIDNEEFVSDVLDGGTTAQEFTDASYSRQTLASKTDNIDTANDEVELDAADVTFTGLDGDTIQGVLVYKQIGGDDNSPGDDPLLAYLTSSSFPATATGADVVIEFSAEGLIKGAVT